MEAFFDIKFQQLSTGGKWPEAEKSKKKFDWPPRIELEMRKDTQFFTTDVCRVVLLG